MKKQKSLSDLIKQAKLSNPDHSLGEVTNLLSSDKKSSLQHKNSFKPRRINKMFNPLNLIVMTTLIAIFSAVLLFNPFGGRELRVAGSELRVAGSELRVEKKENKITELDSNIQSSVVDYSGESKTIMPSSIGSESSDGIQGINNILTERKDTTINGRIFELSKDQLEKLGFLFDDEGYYYLNKMPDGSYLNFWSRYVKNVGGEFGFGKGGWINQHNKQSQTQFDFYPQVITDMTGRPIGQVIRKETDVISAEEFEKINDELIPVLFRYKDVGGYKKQDIIVWFKASKDLLAILGKMEGVDQEQIETMNIIWVADNEVIVDYNFEIKIEDFEGLKLDKETLECLGFSISDSALDYKYEHDGDWLTFFYNQTGIGHNNLSLSKFKNLQDSVKLIASPPLLYGMTDFLGKYHITLPSFKDISEEGIDGDFFDYCIPIQTCEIIGLPNIEKTTFWFYPNERFFSCLPDSIGGPMRKEFNYHKKQSEIVEGIIIEDFVPTKTEEVPCLYFPSFCEGLPGLDNLNVYPNPASEIVNMEVILSRGKSIDYRIFDLSGRLLVDDMPTRKYPKEGKYTEKMDVSGLTPGLYLLVLTDDEGARMTKRIVKN